MPSEKINDTASQGWYTEVRWRRMPDGDDRGTAEGHVQLATVNVHSPFEFPDVETGGHFEAGERFDGWRVTLDEAGIDRLIRTLHKAKRQAFGGPAPTGAEHDMRDVSTIAGYPQWRCVRPGHEGQSCYVIGDGRVNEAVATGRMPPPTLDGVDTGSSRYASGGVIRPHADNSDSIPAFLSEGSGPYSHDPYTGRPAPTMPSHGYRLQPEADEQADPESSTT